MSERPRNNLKKFLTLAACSKTFASEFPIEWKDTIENQEVTNPDASRFLSSKFFGWLPAGRPKNPEKRFLPPVSFNRRSSFAARRTVIARFVYQSDRIYRV